MTILLFAIVSAERAVMMLRGELPKRWRDGGQQKMMEEQMVSVKVDGVVLAAVDIPVRV